MPSSHPARVERVPEADGAQAHSNPVAEDGLGEHGAFGFVPGGAARAVTHARRRGLRVPRPVAAADLLDAPIDAPAILPPVALLTDDDAPPHPAAGPGRAALGKRTVDVVGAVALLVVSAPLLAVLAVLIKLASPGPVLFAHMRLGRGGRPFACYKLRTMCADAERHLAADPALLAAYRANGFKLPTDADCRVTPLGRFLRLSSMDELPQLWNVLRGDMSLVGPRPIVHEELLRYAPRDRRTLLSIRPGITGAWAVGGRSRIGYPERGRVELDYVRRWSLGRDFAILARTVGAVLARRGAT